MEILKMSMRLQVNSNYGDLIRILGMKNLRTIMIRKFF